MATVVTDNKHYSDIAAAIREKTGSEATLLPSEMAEAIANISTGGGTDTLKIVLDQNRDASNLFRYYPDYADHLAQNFDFLNYDTTANVLYMAGAFTDQSLIIYVPTLDTRKVESFNGCFAGCSSLRQIAGWDLRSATIPLSLYGMFSDCDNLHTVVLLNIKSDLDLSMAYWLSTLHEIVQELVDVGATRYLSLNSNVHISDEDLATATSKGWTLVV